MIRRFNYTRREKISRKDIKITLNVEAGGIWFDVDLSYLGTCGFPMESFVFIEAYRQTNWLRFDFGTVGGITQPESRDLSLFETQNGILFRIKVTDPVSGRLIAEADGIPFIVPNEKEHPVEPLLKISPRDLGSEIYQVDYTDEINGPILLINKTAGSYERIGRNPAFVSLVYPSVLREILKKIFYIDSYFDETDKTNWRARWLSFARSFPGIGKMPESADDKNEFDEWIDSVVAVFCKKVRIFEKFTEFWSDEG